VSDDEFERARRYHLQWLLVRNTVIALGLVGIMALAKAMLS